jgi:hypothetical protein
MDNFYNIKMYENLLKRKTRVCDTIRTNIILQKGDGNFGPNLERQAGDARDS